MEHRYNESGPLIARISVGDGKLKVNISRAGSEPSGDNGREKAKVAPRRWMVPQRFDESLDRQLFRDELADHFAINWQLAEIELCRGHLGCAAEILESTRRWFHAHAAAYAAETGDTRYFKIAKRHYKTLLHKAQAGIGKERGE